MELLSRHRMRHHIRKPFSFLLIIHPITLMELLPSISRKESFYYRSTTGLEDYYSYHEQDAGRAGHGYVNDFNGNLVWVHEDASTSGGLLPIHIRHVYNLSERSKNNRMGKGWRKRTSSRKWKPQETQTSRMSTQMEMEPWIAFL